jgi:hypothetical protein
MKINTSLTITQEELEKIEEIQNILNINKSTAIRLSINYILSNLHALDNFLDTNRRESYRVENQKEVVHVEILEEVANRLDTLADLNNTSRSKIIGAAIRSLDTQSLNQFNYNI